MRFILETGLCVVALAIVVPIIIFFDTLKLVVEWNTLGSKEAWSWFEISLTGDLIFLLCHGHLPLNLDIGA